MPSHGVGNERRLPCSDLLVFGAGQMLQMMAVSGGYVLMRRTIASLLVVLTLCGASIADEGLWLFNAVPKDKIKARYKFEVTDAWLNHLRESSVRFNNGG